MKRLVVAFFAVFMLLIATPALAQSTSADLSGLSEVEQAEILKQIAEKKEAAAQVPTTPEELVEYAQFGEAIAKSIGALVNELNVGVNDFAASPVGMISMFLIVWHFFGGQLIGVLFGFTFLAATIPTWVYLYRRQVMGLEIEEGENENGKKYKVTRYRAKEGDHDGVKIFYWISMVAIVVVALIAIFSG